MNRDATNKAKSLFFFATTIAFVTAPPLQARVLVKPFQLDQVAGGQSGYLNPAPTPQKLADVKRSDLLNDLGNQMLTEGNFIVAEADFRESLALQRGYGTPYAGLAEALYGQGRAAEAVQAYQILFRDYSNLSSTTDETRTKMGYAIALSQVGRWPEAVAVYEKALPETTNFGAAPKINIHFDPLVSRPAQLQALAHVASGLQYSGTGETKKAYIQFYQAIHLDPDSAFANYYYGYGWQQLAPTDKAKIANAQQAKAALEKAVKLGKPDVKEAAQKALLVAAKP